MKIILVFFLLQVCDAMTSLLTQHVSLYTGMILSVRKIPCSLNYDIVKLSFQEAKPISFFFFFPWHGMQDLSSLTRDQIHAPCSGSVAS